MHVTIPITCSSESNVSQMILWRSLSLSGAGKNEKDSEGKRKPVYCACNHKFFMFPLLLVNVGMIL